jgi:hypothetical protein
MLKRNILSSNKRQRYGNLLHGYNEVAALEKGTGIDRRVMERM